VSHIRRFALALIAAVGLIAAAVPAASAATDTVTINSVLSPSPGQIAVSVTSTTALTELNVALTSAAHPDELSFTLADFTLESGGTDTDGTYELTSPITDAQLPFDTYTIDVTAGDSGGGSATDNAAILTWLIQPTITINASQTTFDFANPSITFSGNLSLVNPDGSAVTAADLVGQQLSLNGGETSYPVTTGTGGAYSITLNQPLGYADYSAILLATSTTAYGSSPFVYITPIQDPAEVTADVSATQLKDGQTLTVTGTADYNPGSGYVPLPNSPVQLYGGPYYDQTGPTATATTNAEGQYRFSFADHGPGTWYVYAGGVPGNSFFDQVLTQALTITKNVNVAMPVKIAGCRPVSAPSRSSRSRAAWQLAAMAPRQTCGSPPSTPPSRAGPGTRCASCTAPPTPEPDATLAGTSTVHRSTIRSRWCSRPPTTGWPTPAAMTGCPRRARSCTSPRSLPGSPTSRSRPVRWARTVT
jgi:hypothetical protein